MLSLSDFVINFVELDVSKKTKKRLSLLQNPHNLMNCALDPEQFGYNQNCLSD